MIGTSTIEAAAMVGARKAPTHFSPHTEEAHLGQMRRDQCPSPARGRGPTPHPDRREPFRQICLTPRRCRPLLSAPGVTGASGYNRPDASRVAGGARLDGSVEYSVRPPGKQAVDTLRSLTDTT